MYLRGATIAFCLGIVALASSAAERIDATAPQAGRWPFTPAVRPAVPRAADGAESVNPIDAFAVAELRRHGLEPSAPAERLALLRRVTFDLTGLPPTVEDQQSFLADASTDAYERVVDRLLASPHYGERMAQQWLDLARYAESDGFNEDRARPGAYHYRDYCIRAFNHDLPFDRFVRQQLAGDELEPDNLDAQIATGFCRLGGEETNAVDLRSRRQEIIDDTVSVVGQALLGLTVQCARCHDHKFDDIPQADYYRLVAFFQPMLQSSVAVAAPEQIAKHAQQQRAWEEATASIRAEIDAVFAPERSKRIVEGRAMLGPDVCRALDTPEAERTPEQRQLAYQGNIFLEWKGRETSIKLPGDEETRYGRLLDRLAEFDAIKPEPLPTADTVVDAGRVSPPTHRLAVGNAHQPLEEVQAGFPSLLSHDIPRIPPLAGSTGRRSVLAAWITEAKHPLTPRVIVNRVWQWHFGTGLVATSSDFGSSGSPPTHRELLDWLASDFVEHGWSLKRLHRMIVSSATYRQTSLVGATSAAALAADPQNRLLWHGPRRRLDGEQMRDAMLQISGTLNPRMFGPSAHPALPAGVTDPGWNPDADEQEQRRRSIYVFVKRNTRYPMFEAFDAPDRQESCPRRVETTTAGQALAMLNGPVAVTCAAEWATRLNELRNIDTIVRQAYREALAREPSDEEVAAGRAFIERMQTLDGERRAAIVDFCQALFNTSEFLYVD
ncbi:MAG TPA: DUF1549 and DUF1553 domain-containing protein [Pirellulales bacterium]|jgi:hypothetical protein|nr:DUF1549 and DUF1553 domain-containing protein [Pirellulales bacterium]